MIHFSPILLQKPYVLLGLLAVTSLIVPFLEELLKPLALLVVANRNPTPSQGFVGGLICGAAFAFLETSGTLASGIDSGWVVLVLMRLGTGLLHITASGLVGLGLARAWQAKKSRLFFPQLPAGSPHAWSVECLRCDAGLPAYHRSKF